MWRYASFYCQQDVTILRLGFNEFRKGFISDFNIDPLNFISISSLANEVFNERVYYTVLFGNFVHMLFTVVDVCVHIIKNGMLRNNCAISMLFHYIHLRCRDYIQLKVFHPLYNQIN